ncbi:monooxygenase family protein [Amycolatopsis panacis]|uniref:DUF4188 domain-containing protein n=1 Tax=Amycolatopsis panacis TaxID=2340917 RepID=A0A419I8L5_9PSEU|nr:DUF4188 domain-containing protein [Amycolatopsis panacis]
MAPLANSEYNRRTRAAKDVVGIWHETHAVARTESIYVGIPPTGLAAAAGTKPVTSHTDRARQRFETGR